MRYVSIFSGVEAASVAWKDLGWEPVAFSEIDEFPSAVLAARFPEVPNLGDITKVDWSDYHGTVDLVVGGSPCQSFSIAGTRTGLEGASGLMWEYVRCVREVRPRWFVWENVPGALSSAKGEDFRCLLESMDDLGYGLAWRVLDAQFFGVAQRRRRVFLVGSLGDRRSADVLFEPESLRWDYPSSRDKRKELVGRLEESPGKCLPLDTTQVTHPKNGSNPHWGDPCHPLCASAHVPSVVTPKTMLVRCGCEGGGKGALVQDNVSATLSTSNTQTLFQPFTQYGEVAGTLTARYNSSPCADRGMNFVCVDNSEKYDKVISSGYIVRKLTPVECERLQGFPDGWTDVDFKGKKAPDSRRYKAMGNSMAVPVMRWIGERIQKVDDEI